MHRFFLVSFFLVSFFLVLILTTSSYVHAQANTNSLRVQGTKLVLPNGTRFVVNGVNLEMYRDAGCANVSTGQYTVRTEIAQKMKAEGINAVRINYRRLFGNTALSDGQISQIVDVIQSFSQQGIYSMVSDHIYTGESIQNQSASLTIMKKIIDTVRTRNLERYLIMNPYNEPYGKTTWTWQQWIDANTETITYLRQTAGYKGVIVLDFGSWAGAFDATSAQTMMNKDKALLNNTQSNLVFSNHWYPNIAISNVTNTISQSATIPVLVGELGQENPGSSPLNQQYVKDVTTAVVNNVTGGGAHNGIFGWIWHWCDGNSMTESDYLTLKGWENFGIVFREYYWSKINGGFAPSGGVSPTGNGLSPTTATGGTNVTFTLLLHGIGKGGDNVNLQSTGNLQPRRLQRQVTIELYNASNVLAGTSIGTVTYTNGSGDFRGNSIFTNLPQGVYTGKIKMSQYLHKNIPGIISVTGNTISLPVLSLITGDTTSDNKLNISDYNMILDCFSDLTPAKNCGDSNKKLMTDLTDDGDVNQFDYNLFLRELSVQSGE